MREITNDPTFQQAVACLKAHHVPLQTSVRATAEFNNNSLVFYAGYCAALDDLSERATKLHQPRQQDPNETDEWTHIQLNKL